MSQYHSGLDKRQLDQRSTGRTRLIPSYLLVQVGHG